MPLDPSQGTGTVTWSSRRHNEWSTRQTLQTTFISKMPILSMTVEMMGTCFAIHRDIIPMKERPGMPMTVTGQRPGPRMATPVILTIIPLGNFRRPIPIMLWLCGFWKEVELVSRGQDLVFEQLSRRRESPGAGGRFGRCK